MIGHRSPVVFERIAWGGSRTAMRGVSIGCGWAHPDAERRDRSPRSARSSPRLRGVRVVGCAVSPVSSVLPSSLLKRGIGRIGRETLGNRSGSALPLGGIGGRIGGGSSRLRLGFTPSNTPMSPWSRTRPRGWYLADRHHPEHVRPRTPDRLSRTHPLQPGAARLPVRLLGASVRAWAMRWAFLSAPSRRGYTGPATSPQRSTRLPPIGRGGYPHVQEKRTRITGETSTHTTRATRGPGPQFSSDLTPNP